MRIARLPSLHATTLHTAHSALYLAPSTIYTLLLARNSLESTLQTRRSTPHTLLTPQSLHELQAALYSPRSRRDPLNSTLHTETLNSTLQTPPRTQYTPTLHIQYSTHLTRNPPRTLYTPNFRFLTFHKTHSTHLALPNLYVTHNTADSTFHNLRAPPSTTRRDALHRHSTFYTAHSNLHSRRHPPHFTFYISHSIPLYTPLTQYLHTTLWRPFSRPSTIHTPHCKLSMPGPATSHTL